VQGTERARRISGGKKQASRRSCAGQDPPNAAIYATEANLQRQGQLISPNREKISDARRLARQALETKQGKAEAADTIALKKYHELFALKKRLEAR
jgi:hypothetical protein